MLPSTIPASISSNRKSSLTVSQSTISSSSFASISQVFGSLSGSDRESSFLFSWIFASTLFICPTEHLFGSSTSSNRESGAGSRESGAGSTVPNGTSWRFCTSRPLLMSSPLCALARVGCTRSKRPSLGQCRAFASYLPSPQSRRRTNSLWNWAWRVERVS